ncbi:hypothetical protein [Streptomyces longisporoflavus]|uniref:hypothetical protein n=1 Tax=Streptomyces longisporoflavus TaxID=28044 RepID=UPI00167E523C|nr:hypothetical protein [Streptomyces longisporoflavus]
MGPIPGPEGRGEIADAPVGGTRSLLEAVLRELNQGLHGRGSGAALIARAGAGDNRRDTSGS